MNSKAAVHVQARTEVLMGTLVTIQVVPHTRSKDSVEQAIDSAFGWFFEIEERCSRFLANSELRQLTQQVGKTVQASAMLYEGVRFALMLAEETDGAFDPTVGHKMALRGFNREHRTGEVTMPAPSDDDVSYRDVLLDPERKTIKLLRPLTLDLGAVVKGLAIDLAARELEPFKDFSIDAGGDLYLGGLNSKGQSWTVGIAHPRREGELIDTLAASNQAVCTSGDYERRSPNTSATEHHILDPRTGTSPRDVVSATVVAPSAMLADALATAAFVLGADEGLRLLRRMDVDGLIVNSQLQRFETGGLCRA